jgi:DNA invertase Pin-like site-specific DNA recombinase
LNGSPPEYPIWELAEERQAPISGWPLLGFAVGQFYLFEGLGINNQVLTGHGASINTATPEGKLVFGIFAALAEFERELVSERTKVGLASARARGRKGGGQYKMTSANLRLAMTAMGQQQTVVSELCRELGVTRQTLYRHLGPDGSLREDGKRMLEH